MTRVCTNCLEQSTVPWVSLDFVCRRFLCNSGCETRLVNSDIAEMKRRQTFRKSPMNLLPEDGMKVVFDYLCGPDLMNLFLTCSAT